MQKGKLDAVGASDLGTVPGWRQDVPGLSAGLS